MRVTILGAGVLGCSTAIIARAAGHEVRVIAEKRMTDPQATNDPAFASVYPVASVIPRSIPGDGVSALLKDSLSVFDTLIDRAPTGLRMQRHFEVFERAYTLPDYAPLLHGLEESPADLPRRPDAGQVDGYAFDCVFADMTAYAPWLDAALSRLGVMVERRRITNAADIDGEMIINCLGAGAWGSIGAAGPGRLYKGTLVHAPITPLKAPFSYNYTPDAKIYANTDGQAADIYFYPRGSHAVLGGTRHAGQFAEDGSFAIDTPYTGPTTDIDGIAVPTAILDLNQQIAEAAGVSLRKPYTVYIGYRHNDGPVHAPQFTIARRAETNIIDCLGFGGAGVTLSWGAAMRAVALLEGSGEPRAIDPASLRDTLHALTP